MNKIDVTKAVVKFVVGSSVVFVSKSVISTLCVPESKAQKAKLIIGSAVLGAMLGDLAANYVENEINDLVVLINKIKAHDFT